MELADGEGTQSGILRFAQNDSACMFLPFADFFTASQPWDHGTQREHAERRSGDRRSAIIKTAGSADRRFCGPRFFDCKSRGPQKRWSALPDVQPRFFDRALRTVKEYNEKVEYIHLNPVKAGLASRPEDWRWSSYNEYAGMSAEEQKRTMRLDRGPRQDTVRPARENLIALSRDGKDALSGGGKRGWRRAKLCGRQALRLHRSQGFALRQPAFAR
jgi:hypothetical protein